MPTQDRSWFERKVRDLGDVLRRLPRSRQRALVDAIETETTSTRYPETSGCRLISPTHEQSRHLGTWTPHAPYTVTGDAPDARQDAEDRGVQSQIPTDGASVGDTTALPLHERRP